VHSLISLVHFLFSSLAFLLGGKNVDSGCCLSVDIGRVFLEIDEFFALKLTVNQL
jgi:hypothetical protein